MIILEGGKNLYYSNHQPYWHSIFSIVSPSETTDPFHFQILQPLLPFSKSCNPPSVLKILQPPFRSQNPAAPLPFSKSCNPLSVLKILQPPFLSQNPATLLPSSKSCKLPLPSSSLASVLTRCSIFPFSLLLAFPPLSIRSVQLWRDPRAIFNPPKE